VNKNRFLTQFPVDLGNPLINIEVKIYQVITVLLFNSKFLGDLGRKLEYNSQNKSNYQAKSVQHRVDYGNRSKRLLRV
jgi:hypothetical protein